MRVILLTAAAALGCSSSPPATNDAGNDGGATDAQFDAQTDTGPDATVITADSACDDYATLRCDRVGACSSFALSVEYADLPTCRSREHAWCLAHLTAPHTAWTPGKIEACIGALPQTDCASLFHARIDTADLIVKDPFLVGDFTEYPACRVAGTLADGESCGSDLECANGFCAYQGVTPCGVCSPTIPVGASCAGTIPCIPPSLCTSNVCTVSPAVTHAKIGDSCDDITTLCEWGSTCVGGACLKAKNVGDVCNDASCVCAPVDATGQPTFCAPTSFGLPPLPPFPCQCKPTVVVQPGSSCDPEIVTGDCSSGGWCTTSSMICVAPAADGDACTEVGGPHCMTHASCISNQCTPDDFSAETQCDGSDAGTPLGTTLLTSLGGHVFALDANAIYVTDPLNQRVVSCAKTGCSNIPTVLASNEKAPGLLVTDATNVYFTTTVGAVKLCAKTGCSGGSTVLASGQTNPSAISVDTTNVYWVTSDGVASCAITGCGGAPTMLATNGTSTGQFNALAIDSSTLFYTAGTQLFTCPLSGCGGPPTSITTFANAPNRLEVDATLLFASIVSGGTQGSAIACTRGTDCSSPRVYSTDAPNNSIAVDATNVYWADTLTGEIKTCPKTGCSGKPKILAGGQNNLVWIQVDATNVYWTDGLGNLRFVAH